MPTEASDDHVRRWISLLCRRGARGTGVGSPGRGHRSVSCPPIIYPLMGMAEMAIKGIRMRQNVSQPYTRPNSGFTAFLCLEPPQTVGGSYLVDTTERSAPA